MLNIYLYSQNNTGGVYEVNENLASRVYIEAESLEKADEKALELGIYFDGVQEGYDCSCCGDRWSRPYRTFSEDFEFYNETGRTITAQIQADEEVALEEFRDEFGKFGTLEDLRVEKIDDWGVCHLRARLHFGDITNYIAYISYEYGTTTPDAILHRADGTKEKF